MKKIISIFMLTVVMFTMCTINVFAASGLTLVTSTETAVVGDEVVLAATLDTSNGVKTVGFKIAFDPNDFELGTSAQADQIAEEYADYIGTPEYPTLDSVTLEAIGFASYVSDEYISTYSGYQSNKNLGNATIGFEEKDGAGKVGFAYAITTAKGNLNKIDNMMLGGAVLKVKTDAKKESTIKILEATFSGSDNATVNLTTNEVKIALNGYTGEEEEVFDDSFEGFVNDNGEVVDTGFEKGNVATVFAKATEALAAESYGIWFGGCKYVGKLPVDNGEYWVIKLYDPNSVLDSNEDYACKIFVGNSIINEDADYTINPVN